MNAYETVVKKAIEAADQIKDADTRVHAYCCILGFLLRLKKAERLKLSSPKLKKRAKLNLKVKPSLLK